MKYAALILALFITGCAPQWKCIADTNRDSRCKVIDCELDVSIIMNQGDYRIMKIFPSRTAIVYSTNPLTDLTICNREAKQ